MDFKAVLPVVFGAGEFTDMNCAAVVFVPQGAADERFFGVGGGEGDAGDGGGEAGYGCLGGL